MRGKLAFPVAILLLYTGLRLINLGSFPLFIDEAFTIARARGVWMLQPFGGVAQGKPLIPWVVALAYPFGDAVFAARAITLLAGLPGIAALIALSTRLYDHKTGWAAGLVYAMLPYTFFFGRLAMSDVLAANWGLVAAWGVYVSLSEKQRWLALLTGGALAIAVLARLPMVVFLVLPILGWLVFNRKQTALTQTIFIYVAAAVLLLPIVLIGLQAGDFGIGRAQESLVTADQGLRISTNLGDMALYLAWYVGISFLISVVVGAVSGWDDHRRSKLYAALLFLLPTVPTVLFGTFILPRYYVLGIGGLSILATSGIWWLANRAGRWNIYTGIILLIFLLYPFQRFIPGAYFDPLLFRLVTQDQFDYVQGNTSGFGLVAAVEELRASEQPTTVLCTARVTCDRLSAYLDDTPDVTVARVDILSPDWLASEQAAGKRVLLAEDMPPHSQPFSTSNEFELQPLAEYERPGEQSSFALWHIIPR